MWATQVPDDGKLTWTANDNIDKDNCRLCPNEVPNGIKYRNGDASDWESINDTRKL